MPMRTYRLAYLLAISSLFSPCVFENMHRLLKISEPVLQKMRRRPVFFHLLSPKFIKLVTFSVVWGVAGAGPGRFSSCLFAAGAGPVFQLSVRSCGGSPLICLPLRSMLGDSPKVLLGTKVFCKNVT